MRKKILYVVSSVTDSTEYDLLIEHWDRARFDLEFVLMNPMADCGLQQNILKAGFPCTTILYMGRQDSVKAIRAIMGHYKRIKPDIIHLNLLEATFFGLVAARLTGIGRTVYTRHHSTHNHKYHPIKGVMYDRICNRLADRIIAITNNTEEILVEWEKVPKEKVVLIYHGYDMSEAWHPYRWTSTDRRHDRAPLRVEGARPCDTGLPPGTGTVPQGQAVHLQLEDDPAHRTL
jgi:glycosyltransferase involved in cell wall biosynthesis